MRPCPALVWASSLLFGFVNAVLTNRTIDDTDPVVIYSEDKLSCYLGEPETPVTACFGANHTQMMNHTATFSWGDIQIPFTGTAVYVFFGMQMRTNNTIKLDGEIVAEFDIPRFNFCPHSLTGECWGTTTQAYPTENTLSVDDEEETPTSPSDPSAPPPSASTPSTSPSSPSLASTPASTAPSSSTSPSSRKKRLAAAIVGGVIGGLGAIVASLLIARSTNRLASGQVPGSRRKAAQASDVEAALNAASSGPATGIAGPSLKEDNPHPPAERDPSLLAEQVRVLQASSAATASSTASGGPPETGPSLTRSLSTMKREQTQAVQGYEPAARDLLVHTDSGLRLEPGRAGETEELPPTYVEE
ncbi:hypothetical protein FB451DRAFT_1449302 [Mycena latifolia]|nr:hypothetical protein FB451DRAFT_1449302 [Mycena latifolia]